MQIVEDLQSILVDKSIVTIGTFDGLHRGHLHVLNKVIEKAKSTEHASVVITFKEHPALYFSKKDIDVKILSSIEDKKQLFKHLDIDYLIILPFEKIAHMSGEVFIKKILIKHYKMSHLYLGYDNKFGNDQAYDNNRLHNLSKTYNFTFNRLDKFYLNNTLISSTLIRKKLIEGDVENANLYLGYPYFVKGKVSHGLQLGSKLGYPTANIEIDNPNKLFPKYGVYVVRCLLKGKEYNGMCNIGIRPSISNNDFTFEVHLFDFQETIYGEKIQVSFIYRLRDEKKFNSLSDLTNQMKIDEQIARKLLTQ